MKDEYAGHEDDKFDLIDALLLVGDRAAELDNDTVVNWCQEQLDQLGYNPDEEEETDDEDAQ